MLRVLTDLMLYVGCVLMAYNIYRYARFSGRFRNRRGQEQTWRFFLIPVILLVLFLVGYLIIALFGQPDIVVSGILFGGSVFVFVMLLLIQRAADRIQESEKLEAKLLAAEEASRAKSTFLSNMSHDIRTPLNAIIGYTSLAQSEGITARQQSEYIGKIEKASHHLLDIVDDVLEMSRIESGRIELEPHPANLEDCIREAADLVSAQLAEKNIAFSVSCETTHPCALFDKNRLNRALINLLCNAGKFTPEHGAVFLSLRELGCDADIGDYEIRVKDNGIGMSSEFVDKLFMPFERERSSTVSRIQGTGLGMAITKNILDLMGGDIEVQTTKGEGTEFILTFSLPVVEPEVEEYHSEQAVRLEGLRVLLAEDNEVNTEIATMILEQAGVLVDPAENGKVAVEKVKAAPDAYDLILMDIQMPVMDGYAAARAIRSLPSASAASVPIIAMTANAFAEDIHAAEAAGMNGHIAKPIDISIMMTTISDVLSRQSHSSQVFPV